MNDFCTSEAIASHTQSVVLRKVVWRQKLIVKARVLGNRVIKGGYRMQIYYLKILVLKNCNLYLEQWKNHWNLVVWRCSGGSSGGAQGDLPPPLLFLDQTEARRAKKNFFWRLGPPSGWSPPRLRLSQGLYLALICTYILSVVAILLIIGQLINRFSSSVFSPCPDLTVTVQGKHFILSLKVRSLRNCVQRN